jgi:hypothetical protein
MRRILALAPMGLAGLLAVLISPLLHNSAPVAGGPFLHSNGVPSDGVPSDPTNWHDL